MWIETYTNELVNLQNVGIIFPPKRIGGNYHIEAGLLNSISLGNRSIDKLTLFVTSDEAEAKKAFKILIEDNIMCSLKPGNLPLTQEERQAQQIYREEGSYADAYADNVEKRTIIVEGDDNGNTESNDDGSLDAVAVDSD